MKRIVLLLVVAMFIVGCDSKTFEHFDYQPSSKNPTEINYFKDPRTGFCFAQHGDKVGNGQVESMAKVPCTDKVEELSGRSE